MNHIEKTVLVKHSPEEMFELVDHVEDYPLFLPWCAKTEVLERDGDYLEAMLYMDYMKIKQSFGTRNNNIPGRKISMTLLEGPFKELSGEWTFTPLGKGLCKIQFNLQYDFSNPLLSKLIGPVFRYIAANLVDAFIKEADKRYA